MEMRAVLSRGTFCRDSFQCQILPTTRACFPPHIRNRGVKSLHILRACPQTMDLETPGSISDFIIYAINCIHPFVKVVTSEPEWGRELILRFPSKLSVLTSVPNSYS